MGMTETEYIVSSEVLLEVVFVRKMQQFVVPELESRLSHKGCSRSRNTNQLQAIYRVSHRLRHPTLSKPPHPLRRCKGPADGRTHASSKLEVIGHEKAPLLGCVGISANFCTAGGIDVRIRLFTLYIYHFRFSSTFTILGSTMRCNTSMMTSELGKLLVTRRGGYGLNASNN